MLCEASRRGFQDIYTLLGVELEERGESFYNPLLPDVVGDLEASGRSGSFVDFPKGVDLCPGFWLRAAVAKEHVEGGGTTLTASVKPLDQSARTGLAL